jgi:hypothetical protein
MDLHNFFADELPAEAATLIEQYELAVEELRQDTTRRIAQIRQQVDEQINELQSRADEQISEVDRRADERAVTLLRELLGAARPLQEKYLRAGKLDEALTLRDRLRQLRPGVAEVRPDPGYVRAGEEDKGKSFYYEVTGSTEGSVYGTDVYTTDTPLAATAVHAGILKAGQKGIIRVTILKQSQANFKGSTRNGITSYDYSSSYPAFRVSRA